MRRTVLAALAFLAMPAWSATCSVSAQPVSFGNYDPLAALAADGAGQVSVTCSNAINLPLSYAVSLSTGASGSYASRELASGTGRLRYNLFTDPTRLLVWGDGSAGTTRVSHTLLATLLGATANHTVYGRVPARQNVAVGVYADTITVTLEY